MKNIGFVGWRGMVGSVLMQRMIEENNFDKINPIFFSTSGKNLSVPFIKNKKTSVYNAWDIQRLSMLDILVSCHSNSYTKEVYPKLRKIGWRGYWIDSSSLLRMSKDSIIILDPVNYELIQHSIGKGIKTFVIGNCTVNLMLMSLGGLFDNDLIEWISFATYQAASGAGINYVRELLHQIKQVYKIIEYNSLEDTLSSISNIESQIFKLVNNKILKSDNFGIPLIFNLIPWIGNGNELGQSKEEWKFQGEINKILINIIKKKVLVDGVCVRIGALRCHSQVFTIKLKKNISLSEVEYLISNHNHWVKVIPNDREMSIRNLNPIAVTNTLKVFVGRLRKLSIGNKYLSAFAIGDQLLWGSAEPIRRILFNFLIN